MSVLVMMHKNPVTLTIILVSLETMVIVVECFERKTKNLPFYPFAAKSLCANLALLSVIYLSNQLVGVIFASLFVVAAICI